MKRSQGKEMGQAEMLRRLDRLDAECGAELRDSDGSPGDMAAALLECDDPPKGDDRQFCEDLVNGSIVITSD